MIGVHLRNRHHLLNSLIKFTKEGGHILPPRQLIATYLTAPEWQNVRSSQKYADFIQHTPFYAFPYFQEIKQYWKVYKNSWNAARQHASFLEVATSEYNIMNIFIGTVMTFEYTAKGIISAPINWYYSKHKEAETIPILTESTSEDISQIDPRINLIAPNHLEIPRYTVFQEILQKLASHNINFTNIAGQSIIQVDIIHSNPPLPEGCRLLYKTADRHSLEVDVPHLAEALRTFRQEGIPVAHIYDY